MTVEHVQAGQTDSRNFKQPQPLSGTSRARREIQNVILSPPQALPGGAPEREAVHGARLPGALPRQREGRVDRQVAPRLLLPHGGGRDQR